MKENPVEKLLSWAEDRRELKNLMGKYAQCLLLRRDREIVDLLWSRARQDICYGCNDGYYFGEKAVRGYFTSVAERTEKATALLRAALPEAFEGKSPEASLGAGWLEFKPVQNPVIGIGPNGTAKAVWYSQGNTTEIGPAGPMAFWTFGSYDAEFVREDGDWRFLKLVYLEDIRCPVGADWRWPEAEREKALPEFAALVEARILPPNRPEKLRCRYSPARPFARLPEPPAEGSDLPEAESGLPEAERLALHRVLAREKIEQLMGRRVFYSANLERGRELEELWVSSPSYRRSASFGGTWGFHVGMEEIRRFYVDGQERRLQEALRTLKDAAPGQDPERGHGFACAHPLQSPAIQVSGDGKTAKGLWYSIGYINRGAEAAMWVCGKVAADFVLEEGEWRIWHLCEVHDGTLAPGRDFGDEKVRPAPGEDPLEADFGRPTIPVMTHDRLFCWADDFPWMPEPYETMAPELGYDYAGFLANKWEAAKL